MTRWRSSVRLRLATLYVAGLCVLLLSFGAGVYALVRARLLQDSGAQADAELGRIERYLAQEDPALPEELEEPGYAPFLLLDEQGRRVYVSADWTGSELPTDANTLDALPQHAWTDAHGRSFRVSAGRLMFGGRPVEAFAALDQSDTLRSLQILLWALAGGTAVTLVCALFLGHWLAGRALAPVAELARAAERVGARDSAARLPVGEAQDEFGRLALAFNALLERLQGTLEELRRFSSNVSHELRTPLTAARLVGEQALRRGLDARGEEAIASMLEELDRLTNLIEQLLYLARAEGPEAESRSQPVALAALVREVVHVCGVLAEEREQRLDLELDEQLVALAHPLLLRQALTNLLDNAIRYTPQGGHVRVCVRAVGSEEAALEVVDDGPGIAAADQARIFARFERLPQAGAPHGAGLGLAIARRAVETCRGRIELASAIGRGSCFRIVLPRATASPRVEDLHAAQETLDPELSQS